MKHRCALAWLLVFLGNKTFEKHKVCVDALDHWFESWLLAHLMHCDVTSVISHIAFRNCISVVIRNVLRRRTHVKECSVLHLDNNSTPTTRGPASIIVHNAHGNDILIPLVSRGNWRILLNKLVTLFYSQPTAKVNQNGSAEGKGLPHFTNHVRAYWMFPSKSSEKKQKKKKNTWLWSMVVLSFLTGMCFHFQDTKIISTCWTAN